MYITLLPLPEMKRGRGKRMENGVYEKEWKFEWKSRYAKKNGN
jgi:hypothetical protein